MNNGGALAITSAKFKFHGIAAHAAAAPDRSRSALHAVTLMGNGLGFMPHTLHSYERGDGAERSSGSAELYLMGCSPASTTLNSIRAPLGKVANGRPMMTETKFDMRIINSNSNGMGNDPSAETAQKNLEEVVGFAYPTEGKAHFGEESQNSLPLGAAEDIASTATVDVSWNVSTIGFSAATFVPGVAAHTWQATACAGMTIGQKGMITAAKAIAITAADLFADPQLVAPAKTDLQPQLAGKSYYSGIPAGQKPPLDYRK